MGRKRKNAVYSFFSFDKETNMSTCLVSGCTKTLKGEHGTNLLYHLSSNHAEEYNIVKRRNQMTQNTIEEDEENDANINNIPSTSSDSTNIKKGTQKRIDYLKNECINLVTVHGRPFALMEDLAFKNILSMTSVNSRHLQSINAHSIRDLVSVKADEKRQEISLKLKNKLIALKVDSATCHTRSFFGINAQLIENGKIILLSLGVIELNARSTSEYLKEKLLYVLRKYNVSVDQIFTITTDNGANMIKMTKLLQNIQCNSASILNNDDDNDDDSDISDEGNVNDADEIIQVRLNNETINAENVVENYCVSSVRCAAHTLQLAIEDALREDEALYVIEEARNISRRLRTPTMRNVLKAAKKKQALLDCTTRWNSTLEMMQRLVELRDCCSTTPGEILYVSTTSWNAIEDIIQSLIPSKILSKTLQSEQLTFGDFFYYWTKCVQDTTKILVPLAQYICMHMRSRQKLLMENKTFISILYLDPRFQVILSPEDMATAVQTLKSVWIQMLTLETRSYIIPNTEDTENNENSQNEIVVEDEVELMLAQAERQKRHCAHINYIQSRENIVHLLQEFSRHPRLHSKSNILEFWEKKKLSDPHLFQLANTVLATPATQVSVERLFSSLKFILTTLRYNLKDNIVEDILVLRNNT